MHIYFISSATYAEVIIHKKFGGMRLQTREFIFRWITLTDMRIECSPMVRKIGVQSQVESYQRLKKMVLDAALHNTQHYKVRIKDKVEQSMKRSSVLLYTTGVVAIEKGAFGSLSTKVANNLSNIEKAM